jgi:multicomponent K+:H+ antiporter subunit E
MRRALPFALVWALLVAMWLALYETVAPAQFLLGGVVALAGVWGLRALQAPDLRLRRPRVAAELVWLVFVDIVRSNIAVGRITLHPGIRGRTAGFVRIPLALRNPVGLAALACIVTSTPGTAWAGYESRSGVLTLHILDLVDEETWVHTVKQRYERRLLEILE